MSLTSLNRNYSNHPVSCQRGRFVEAHQVRNDEIRTATWHAPSKKSRPNIRRFSIPTKKLSCSRSYLGPEEALRSKIMTNEPLFQPFVLYNQLSLSVAIRDLF